MQTIKAWHFVGETLRDGRPVPKDGVWLKHDGRMVMCHSGLHASLEPFDALIYAPGNTLCLVECAGKIIYGENNHKDKLICSERKIIVRMDAEPLLRYFARMQALLLTHLWDTPDVVLEYLMTGREESRSAASAANYAASVANYAASVANYAASVAYYAASAAYSAASSAASAASAAYYAASAAYSAANYTAYSAANYTAYSAAKNKQQLDFNTLVYQSFEDWL